MDTTGDFLNKLEWWRRLRLTKEEFESNHLAPNAFSEVQFTPTSCRTHDPFLMIETGALQDVEQQCVKDGGRFSSAFDPPRLLLPIGS